VTAGGGVSPVSPELSKPEPAADGFAGEFYAFCGRGELRFQRCADCGAWRHPPRLRCARCGSAAWSWEASSRRGTVFTWTVVHQPLHPAFAADVPYGVVVVETDEGVRLVANTHGIALDALVLGLPVQVGFDRRREGLTVPVCRPA
jgi:uncharacterized OB-fold protein